MAATRIETPPDPEVPRTGKRRVVDGILLIGLGLGLVALVATGLDLSDGALLTVVFLCPLLAYLILTGQLTEFGAGGVTAKFRDAARRPVKSSVRRIAAQEAQTVEKLETQEVERIDALERDKPVVLTLVLGARGDRYRAVAVEQYLDRLKQFPRFRFVVLIDPEGRAVAYMPAEIVAGMVGTDTEAKPLIGAVNAGHLPGMAALRTEFLSTETTAGAAVQRMTELSIDAMPVRDRDGRLVGILEREDVLAQFLLEATGSDWIEPVQR